MNLYSHFEKEEAFETTFIDRKKEPNHAAAAIGFVSSQFATTGAARWHQILCNRSFEKRGV